jgi:hypothetical protein
MPYFAPFPSFRSTPAAFILFLNVFFFLSGTLWIISAQQVLRAFVRVGTALT